MYDDYSTKCSWKREKQKKEISNHMFRIYCFGYCGLASIPAGIYTRIPDMYPAGQLVIRV
jgi:hypothetical protein